MPSVVFEPRDQHGKAEQVETAIGEHEIFLERSKNFALLARDALHLLDYG